MVCKVMMVIGGVAVCWMIANAVARAIAIGASLANNSYPDN